MIRKHLPWLATAALLLTCGTAAAHVSYSGRDFGTIVPNAAPVTITGQTVTGNYGWADGTDADYGDSHKMRAFRFTLAAPAYVTVSFSASTNGGTRNGSLKPGFSIYQGLAHVAPITNAPGSPDHDTSAISLAYLATLGGVAKEGCFRSLNDWRMGGDNQTGPVFNFDAADGLSTFLFKGYAVDGDSSLFGVIPGVTGDGNADGRITKSFYLPAGDYSIFVGGANYAGQLPTPDGTSYGLEGTISASAFTYVAGDPAEGGIGYQHQVTLGKNSSGSFSGLVGAWSWEDNSLFGGDGQGTDPVGWTHTSNWAAVRVQSDTLLTITMARDATVPWAAAPEELNGLGDTAAMYPSFTLWRGWDNDGDDYHTYNNHGNVDWAEDLQYVDHLNNSSATTVTRTYFLPAGDYTLALGSNADTTNGNLQGYKVTLATGNVGKTDPVAAAGGIGYTYTVVAGADEAGSFSGSVGAWSWEDNSLFGNEGQSPQPVGWTHTSNWLALKLTEEVYFSLTMERDATVPWAEAPDELNGFADTVAMYPSLTLYRGWDNDGADFHTYNNRGNVSWAEDIRYLDHVDNSKAETITRTWRLPAGEYTFALGSNADTTNANRQGYKATYTTHAVGPVLNADPAPGGIGYAHTIAVGRGDSGEFTDHVGAWSWEDNSLFGNAGQGTDPVGWTHTSCWVALNVKDHLTLNITMARQANVPDVNSTGGVAGTASMYPSFTLWRGWDNDIAPLEFRTRPDIVAAWQPYGGVPADLGDHHTYNNRGNVDWAEDLTYIDHCDNRSAGTITRSYTLAPGYYTFALGSNAPATDDEGQGFKFSWTTGAPSLVPPVIAQQPKGVEILATKSASFSVKASGPSLTYQWFFKGAPIKDATKEKLEVKDADLTNAGAYTCTVRNAAGWVTTSPAVLVVIAKPVVDPFHIPNLTIGQFYQIQLTASNNPAAFAVKGLPKGLAFNAKSGLISGRPTEVKTCTVEVTATNKAGTSDKATDAFVVTGLLTGTNGTFTAPLGRSAAINGLLGGSVKFQVSSLGAFSGAITLGKNKAVNVAAGLDTSLAAPTASFSIPRAGLPALTGSIVIDPAARLMYGQITDGSDVLPFIARQPLAVLGAIPGSYTFALPLDPLDVGNAALPQGHSTGAFLVAATGTTTGVLLLADNTKVTFGGGIEQGGTLTLFSVLYKGAGSVLGLLSIDAATGDLAASEVSWFKDAIAKELVYGEGFGPLELGAIGRKYAIPAANKLPLGADAGAGNAAITFAEGGAPSPATRLNTAAIQIEAAKVTVSNPNPGNVKLTIDAGKTGKAFVPGANGVFKGTFELTDNDSSVTPNKNLVRKVDFQGMIVDDGAKVKGYGFFLLPKTPTASPKTTLATAPKLSGSVQLEAVPVAVP